MPFKPICWLVILPLLFPNIMISQISAVVNVSGWINAKATALFSLNFQTKTLWVIIFSLVFFQKSAGYWERHVNSTQADISSLHHTGSLYLKWPRKHWVVWLSLFMFLIDTSQSYCRYWHCHKLKHAKIKAFWTKKFSFFKKTFFTYLCTHLSYLLNT